ncbi:hypothetical protein QMK33_20130 [Hymenobacter sp. H14-R3]|uniref:hypothetical protein n=1 Tax=Hymenobacter sp. H14-R3 TaxID=3046308 RepID=UPI0024B8DB9D|nr:hypothetical protein [Hymenobacter sp. H14-R3]MDJ0367464.1 hypothetical protein [Hymenobacter sp. H14-R3]
MIRIIKSATVPVPLATRGSTDRPRLEKKYAADPAACQVPGNKLLEAREGIYKDERVKLQLRIDQHDKCCYCETKGFAATSYEAVEHFRPKGGYQQAASDPLTKPGYYWLAYEWHNLYLACTRCNTDYKGNLFPLRYPAARAHSHADALSMEEPLLPDLATEDPTRHLTFRENAAQALDARGQACIDVFGLDRPALIKQRQDHLCNLHNARIVGAFDLSAPLSTRARKFLRDFGYTLAEGKQVVANAKQQWTEAAFDSAQFASMVRAKFPGKPIN